MQSLLAIGSASVKIASIGTMHMSWISGNLNELEDPAGEELVVSGHYMAFVC